MKFNLRAMNADAQNHQNQIHHLFSEQSISVAGQDMIRRRFEMRETIRREIEKERIREEIIAEEMARRRVLEAEVRNELMMERQMAMRRGGGGFLAPFMHLSLAPSHKDMCEPNRRLFGAEEKLVMSIDEKYDRGGFILGESRRVTLSPIPMLGDSSIKVIPAPVSEDNNNKEVIVLNKPDEETRSGTKRKSTPPISEGSSQPGEVRSKKKVKEEWSCAICQISTTSQHGLTQHIQGKKHQIKEAALVAQKTGANFGLGVPPNKPVTKQLQLALTTINMSSSETNNKPSSSSNPNEVNKKAKFKLWCEMCQVGAFSEAVMNDHKEGKKHSTRLVELYGKDRVDSEASATENPCDPKDKTETETESNQAVVVAAGVETVEDDMAYVAAVAAEENNAATTVVSQTPQVTVDSTVDFMVLKKV